MEHRLWHAKTLIPNILLPLGKNQPSKSLGMGLTAHLKPPRLPSILKQKTTQTTKAGRISKTYGTISKQKSNNASK